MRRNVKILAVLGLSGALVVACAAQTPSPSARPPEIAPSAAAPPRVEPSASSATSHLADVVIGGDRLVTVQVPPGYDPEAPAPLLILLHGYGSSGKEHDAYFHLGDEAAKRGYLYAYPDGTRDRDGNRFWNATDACCDFDPTGVDDAAYLSGIIKEIGAAFAVDPKRIHVIGHSNGGFMSYALACTHADQVAAIASLAGATFADATKCAPTEPVAVLEIHGAADDTIAYQGGSVDLGGGRTAAPYPGAEASVATWATYDGCSASSLVDEHVDVDADIGSADAPAEAEVTRSTGCRPGGAAELWTIQGGGHAPNISAAFPAAVLDFFDAHPKP